MRVLFAGAPAAGHLFPLVPLASAFRAAGHEVVIASLDGGDVATRFGLPFVNIQPGVDWRTEIRALGAEHRPDLLARTIATNSADREAFVPLAALVNISVAEPMVALAEVWRPDLIVFEYLFPAGLLAGTALGIRAVQHDLGFTRTTRLRSLMVAEMAACFAPYGVPTDVPVIDVTPRSMTGGVDYGIASRPTPLPGSGSVPEPLSRPRIAVTLGTVPPKVDGLDRLSRVVSAAANLDVEVVLVMGDIDIGSLGPLPPNVRPMGWVPWHKLLGTCAAAIHHGGAGTALAALDAGIPQLVLPDGSDRYITAAAVHARGAGLQATAEEVNEDLLETLLRDTRLRKAAQEVSAEIAAMPSPTEVMRVLGG
jgi:UDP:flavonoid glycosyltransferase YjiC (YdhE family)